jgi:hypothetical protein
LQTWKTRKEERNSHSRIRRKKIKIKLPSLFWPFVGSLLVQLLSPTHLLTFMVVFKDQGLAFAVLFKNQANILPIVGPLFGIYGIV